MAFLTYSTRLSNAGGHRRYDDNGYLFVDESPILRAGILEYLGEELIDGGSPDVDGQKIDPRMAGHGRRRRQRPAGRLERRKSND